MAASGADPMSTGLMPLSDNSRANAPYRSTYYQYFNSDGKVLPNAIPVRVELDPPFKTYAGSGNPSAEQTFP